MKYIFMIIAIIIIFAYTASADGLYPTIGEIKASGTTPDDEFIVLQNTTSQSIALDNWSIQYKSANGSTYYKKNFVKGATIAANGTFVICGKNYVGACDMKHSSFSLSAAGGTIFLVSNQVLLTSNAAPTIIAQRTYAASSETTNPNEASTAADPNTDVTAAQPATPPIVSTPRQPTTMLITINEFMPAFVNGKEWIELFDGTGYAVDLENWTLSDGTGKNFKTLDGLIMPNGFKLIELDSSRLNDSGDLIILRDANKNIVDEVAYGDWDNNPTNAPTSGADVAVARIGDGRDTNQDNSDFALTTTPTPGAANAITAPIGASHVASGTSNGVDDTLTVTSGKLSKTDTRWLADLLSKQNEEIAKLLKAENIIIINNLVINAGAAEPIKTANAAAAKTAATKISTTTAAKTTASKTTNAAAGMVIVPADIVGKDICVVREENRSVEVRLPSDLKQTPVAGDIIKTNGTWSTAKTLTLPRLLVKKGALVTITDHNDPPEPLSIPMSRASEHLGEIISTTGTIVEKQPTRLRIADGPDSLLIKTNFAAAKGDKLSATGLVVKSGVDLLLTALSPDALLIIKPPQNNPSLTDKALPYGLAALPAGILSTAVYFGKRLKKKGGEKQ